MTRSGSDPIIVGMKDRTDNKRQRNKRQSGQAILKASRRLFSSVGYDTVTMDDIAAKAHVSRATLYNYFPSKESLLTGTLDAVYDQICMESREAGLQGTPPDRILYETFQTLVGFTVKYPGLTRRISYLNTLPDSTLYHCLQPIYDRMKELIRAAFPAGDAGEPVSADAVLETMLGMYYVVLNHWDYRYPEEYDLVCRRLKKLYTDTMKIYPVRDA